MERPTESFAIGFSNWEGGGGGIGSSQQGLSFEGSVDGGGEDSGSGEIAGGLASGEATSDSKALVKHLGLAREVAAQELLVQFLMELELLPELKNRQHKPVAEDQPMVVEKVTGTLEGGQDVLLTQIPSHL